MNSEAQTYINPTAVPVNENLYQIAQELMVKANSAREGGDMDAFRRLMRAALDCMTEEQLPEAPLYRKESTQITKLRNILTEGWQEVSILSEKTGLPAGQVHTLLATLRKRGENVQGLAFKKYRIAPATQ